jgi:hypothetical protein
MTRFLTILAAAVVAGVMYVAAAPGGLRSSGPTAAQFKALKARVAKLQTTVGQVKKLSTDEAIVLVGCLMHEAQAVDQRGATGTSGTTGYFYGTVGANANAGTATALDLAPAGETTSQFYFLAVDPACAPSINSSGVSSAALRSDSTKQLLARLAAKAR